MTETNFIVVPTLEQIKAAFQEVLDQREEKVVTVHTPNPLRRYNCKQLAEEYNMTESAIRNKIYNNTIPYHRDGGAIYFIRTEIEQWLVTRP